MRSRAKASVVGSNSARGGSLGSSLVALGICLSVAACLLPGSAFAGKTSPPLVLSNPGKAKLQTFALNPLPAVFTQDADGVTTTTATLRATVNPEGNALTECRFDYVPASQFKVDRYESVTPAQQAPCTPGAASIPADSAGHAVKADVSGLNPDATYYYRLVAATSEGTSNGADRTLTTAIGAPTVSGQSAETVGTSDATLSAKINPKGAKTTYHVEYGTTTAYGQSTAESAPIGFQSDDTDHTVSVHIGGLPSATTYHFRFVATSPAGKAEGTDTSFITYEVIPGSRPCSNDRFRTAFGSRLPDCRAYEQVTPTDKNGADAQGAVTNIQASSDGDRVTFYLNSGLPTTGGSSEFAPFMASRGSSGWTSDGLLPLLESDESAHVIGWSGDLATTLVGGDVRGVNRTALYLRDSATAVYQIGFMGFEGLNRNDLFNVRDRGFAADTSHLIFETRAPLLSGAAAGEENLYELNHGALTLPGRIPAGLAASCDDAAGPACVPAPEGVSVSNRYLANNISRDGSKVFFTDRASKQLYVREDGTRTLRASVSQKTNGGGPGGGDPLGPKPPEFHRATPDGAYAFFTSSEELTDDANTGVSPAIGSANLDGTDADHGFIPVPKAAAGVAAGPSHVYWANPAAGTIGRANLDGTGVNQSFISGASNPTGIAVNGSHLYWTNVASGADAAGTIGRANLDGTGVNQSFISGASNPQDVALDGSFIYWANSGNNEATRSIGRADLDGTSPEQSFLALGGPKGPTGVAVNASFIYWSIPATATEFVGKIERATLAGASHQVIAKELDDPRDLTLDGSYLYWAANGDRGFSGANSKSIGRVKLDGSEMERQFIITSGAGGVAVDGAHLYWTVADGGDLGNDLYRYHSASGELTDLSASSDAGNVRGADVKGFLGSSDDGSYVYFVANGVLAPGAQPGDCTDDIFNRGTCNLYLAHAGSITFIAQLEAGGGGDGDNWERAAQPTSRVASGGSSIVFSSRRTVDLSGQDHDGACPGGRCLQLYRYSSGGKGLTCVTCTTTGTRPREGLSLASNVVLNVIAGVTPVLTRNLSADGNRFFFETFDALLPTDTNGVGDVYEWEARGSGSCESESLNGGCLYLISSGTSPEVSHFADASADGDHVLFFTSQQLVSGDRDQLKDIYDAGVGAGLASQHTLAPPTCASAVCQINPPPPPDQPASSAVFSGPGNVRRSPAARKCARDRRQVRRPGRVRCPKAHKLKRHKRHSNRGGSK